MSFQPLCILLLLRIVLVSAAGAAIARNGWTITADNSHAGNGPELAIYGRTDTFYHSEYVPNSPLPHVVVVDMKQQHPVNGISYQPRQDNFNNGNVGQHIIELSIDGKSWTAPVALGTYFNDKTTKVTSFVTRSARYVKFTAVTEAQNPNNPWTSIAELNILSPGEQAVQAPDPRLGLWMHTIDFPLVPVAAAQMYDTGEILVWSSSGRENFPFPSPVTGQTWVTLWSPTTNAMTQRIVVETEHDMFCPGISMDAAGRYIVTGGDSATTTSIFDPTSNQWKRGAPMNVPRGYQSTTLLSDGRLFTLGGSFSGHDEIVRERKFGEVYDVVGDKWTELPGCIPEPIYTKDKLGQYRQDNHPWMFRWKQTSIFIAGPASAMNWYGVGNGGTQKAAGIRGEDPDAMCGIAVMYDAPAGKIFVSGGAVNYDEEIASSNAHVITLDQPNVNPRVDAIGRMNFPRIFHNGVALPDGTTLILGGNTIGHLFSDRDAVLVPELWDPRTGQYTRLNPHATARNYHSIAVLLFDGTVLHAGGGLCGDGCDQNHNDGEVFVPPYLLNSNGSLRQRPVITSISAESVNVGGTLTIKTDVPTSNLALMRLTSVTHTVNTDQRRIPFDGLVVGTSHTIKVPTDSGIALPGYYMLFAMKADRTPSIAKIIRVTLPATRTFNLLTVPDQQVLATVPEPDQRSNVQNLRGGKTGLEFAPLSFNYTQAQV
ncbi:galactose oxidase mutant W290f [Pseudovirgaria hyperparasitica]|uniref:Galactose oxidase mutant W290f n=1 Tax=Pseudovirgaria hyperparasitica TaxID=470096 RepID=A0A6A6W949_9PEZI|nr:galactose oxidase mutant W290f [Pseudovirgaria hyperparasitica]KAF2758544.1 galactose oxidase mutant W290f [Pseudovirgaria hyperparasitica]